MEVKDNPDARIRVPRFLLSEQNAFHFQKMGETVQFRPEQMLAVPGCYPRYCYFIRSGRVIAGTVGGGSEDKRILLSFEQNTLLLEQYLLTGKRCDLYYKAVEKTTAQMISYHDLTYAMKADFSVTLDVLNAISDLGALAHQRQRNESSTDARQKVCNQFLDFILAFGEEMDGKIVLGEKLTQEKIGMLAGLHRITVSREIKKLKERGILNQNDGFYSISDIQDLIDYRDSCPDETDEKDKL